MKLCVSHYNHKSIPDAKFEAGNSSSFRDMTSQNFPRKKGISRKIRLFTTRKTGLTLKKMSFYVLNHSSRPKIDPPCQLHQFSSRGNFSHFQNFWGVSIRKEQPPPRRLINFAKIWSEHVLRIKTKSQKVWASYNKRFLIGSCEFGHPGL